MIKKKDKPKKLNSYKELVNTNFEQEDILSSYMSILNQMKSCSFNGMCNDIDLYYRYCNVNFEDNSYK